MSNPSSADKLSADKLSAVIAKIIALDPAHPRAAILEKLMLRRVNIETFVGAPGRRNAFIMIEKVNAARPKSLFGQPVDSLAYSRISLFAGRAEGSDWVAGDHIISWDISDHVLARMTLDNSASNKHPMTVSIIDGAALEDYAPVKPDFRAMMNEQAERIADRYDASMRDARDKLARGGKPTKPQIEALAERMRALKRNRDVNFVLQQHMENVMKTRTALEFEIIAAATQVATPTVLGFTPAHGVSGDFSGHISGEGSGGGRGEGFESDGWIPDRIHSPVWDAVCNQYTPEEEVAMAEGIEALVSHHLAAVGGDPLNYDVKSDMHAKKLHLVLARIGAGKPLGDDAKKLESLSKMHNTFHNEHVLKDRRAARPRECGCSIGRINGDWRSLHSAYAGSANVAIQMTVDTAIETESFGTHKVDGVESLAQVEFSCEEFMSALRDGVLGHKTPCTLSRLFGLATRETAAPVSEATQIMGTVDAAMSAHEADLDAVITRLDHLIGSGGLSAKADRTAAIALVDEALKIYSAYRDAIMDAVSRKAENLEISVKAGMQRKFETLPTLGESVRARAIKLISSL